MDAANPFAQTPLTPEPIIAQVSRQLRVESADGSPDANRLVEGLVDRVVRDLWSSRVKTFVPILALRETRDLLRGAHLTAVREHAEAPTTEAMQAVQSEHQTAQLDRGGVAIGHDALSIDWRDALRVDDDVLPL
jgi:hypothetical protein